MCACAASAVLAGAALADAGRGEALAEHQRVLAPATDVITPMSRLADPALQRRYLALYQHVKRERAGDPGRNIVLRGVRTRRGAREATVPEVRRSVRVLRRMLASRRARSGGPAPAAPGSGAANPQLQAIAACESGGNPGAVGGGGAYRGKYQFSVGTWRSVGGTGDPAAAPEAEQDRRAAMLLARDGAGHWPNCG